MSEYEIRSLWKNPEYREKASNPTCTICGLDYRVCNSHRVGLKCVPAA